MRLGLEGQQKRKEQEPLGSIIYLAQDSSKGKMGPQASQSQATPFTVPCRTLPILSSHSVSYALHNIGEVQ